VFELIRAKASISESEKTLAKFVVIVT
jgi:hypothetical protein